MADSSSFRALHPLQPDLRTNFVESPGKPCFDKIKGVYDPLTSTSGSGFGSGATASPAPYSDTAQETSRLCTSTGLQGCSRGDCGQRAKEDPGKGRYLLHKVSRLDTLAGLAIKYGVQVEQLKRVNRLTSDMQMFALGEVRIPLSRDGSSPLPSPLSSSSPPRCLPATSTKACGNGNGLHAHPTPRGKESVPRSAASTAAAAVAAGREAAAASVQLVGSIDPDLLLGVKGLRSTVTSGDTREDRSGRGSNAMALLLALQQPTSRRSSLGMGISVEPDNPLARLTQSPSIEHWEDDLIGVGTGTTVPQVRSRERQRSLPSLFPPAPPATGLAVGARRSLFFGGEQARSGSFWEHEFGGEEQPLTAVDLDKSRNSSAVSDTSGHTLTLRGLSGSEAADVTTSAILGTSITGEQLTMRRRSGTPGTGRVRTSTEDGSGLSSGEEQEGAGWLSADEYVSGRADVVRIGGGGGTASNRSRGVVPRSGGGKPKAGVSGRLPVTSLRTGNSSTSFESLDRLQPLPVTSAANWGTRVIDDLLGQLRRSSVWLMDRSSHWDNGASSTSETRGETGIDLPVLTRTGGSSLGPQLAASNPGVGVLSTADKDGVSWASGPALATMRRSSKGKTALD